MITVVVIPADEAVLMHKRQVDGKLRAFQRIVGGYIENVDLGNESFYVNEEGKIRQLPFNRRATAYFMYRTGNMEPIVGNVVMVGPVDADGNEQSVPEDVLELLGFD